MTCGGNARAQWPGGSVRRQTDPPVPVGGCALNRGEATRFARQYRISDSLPQPDDAFALDLYLGKCSISASYWFGVHPAFGYYDDSDGPNAFATPVRLFGGGKDEGTVLFGNKFLHQQLGRGMESATALAVIVAHEFAHIYQYGHSCESACPSRELEADFLAGWMLARHAKDQSDFKISADPAEAAAVMFSYGDYLFNAPGSHGTPEQRLRAVRRGFSLGQTGATVEEAYDAGIAGKF